jgi:IMP dehydrogenase/GMP reductase
VLALAAAVTFGVLWQQELAEERAEAELKRQATEFVTALTNFSAETIEQDAERIQSFATQRFERETDVFFGGKAIQAIKQARVRLRGEVESVYVQSFDEDTASVFAVVTQRLTNASSREPSVDIARFNFEMVKTDAGWKVSDLEFLQSPGTVAPPGGAGAPGDDQGG